MIVSHCRVLRRDSSMQGNTFSLVCQAIGVMQPCVPCSALKEEGLLQRLQVGERVRRLTVMCWKLKRQLSITCPAAEASLEDTSEAPLNDSGLATQPADAVQCAPLQLPAADAGALLRHADPNQVTASAAADAKVAGGAGGEDTSEVLEACLLSLTMRKEKVSQHGTCLRTAESISIVCCSSPEIQLLCAHCCVYQ